MDIKNQRKLNLFFAKFPIKRFDKGEVIIRAGDESPGAVYVVSGQVIQYDITDQGVEMTVDVFRPNAVLPLEWLINARPNQYFYEAFRATEIRVAPPDEFMKFLDANPVLVRSLLSRSLCAMGVMQRRMAHLMSGVSINRVMFELITQCKRFGVAKPSGECELDLHEDELARRAGLTRETVNRELGKLKDEHLVTVNHKYMIVNNLEGLEEKLNSHL